ncbi:hypothetical protein TKK_0012936 [Trichogramma kaykai]
MSSTFMSIGEALGQEQLEKLELVLKLINNTNLTLNRDNPFEFYTIGPHKIASVTIQGDIRINGQTAESTIMRQISSFMYQDDIFIETMTVFELMWFTAKLRLEYKMDNSSLEKTINDILQEVGLLSRKNHKIGATEHTKILSGGEKKRLSFAAELISNPMVLFLDEPTTGQDAFTANILIKYLKKLTMKNRTILCTLHQPSSELFNYFDNVIIIADGRVAFFGTNLEAMKFFAGDNSLPKVDNRTLTTVILFMIELHICNLIPGEVVINTDTSSSISGTLLTEEKTERSKKRRQQAYKRLEDYKRVVIIPPAAVFSGSSNGRRIGLRLWLTPQL